MKFKTIAIIGFPGVGKTALVNDLTKFSPGNYNRVITATTRSVRENEVDKIDYHFMSKEDFEIKVKNKEFIEHAKYNGFLYGTPTSSFSDKKINLVVLEPSGIMNLYNHPKINLINVVNIQREYSTILNSIQDEVRIRQITSRKMTKEDEKEYSKLPDIIKSQIIDFDNNSNDIRNSSINFNQIFNITNIVNLYGYDLKSFMDENLKILKTISKTKNETLKFLIANLTNKGQELIKNIDEAKEKNDLFIMSRLNSFMDNLETLKIYNKTKSLPSDNLSKNSLMDIHSRISLINEFQKIKLFHNENLKNFSEDKKIIFKILEKDIAILKNSDGFIEKKIFRDIEKNTKILITYKKLLELKILNPIILNSSFLVDYTHIQYEKYGKKHFRLTIDKNKMDLLSNDTLYKIFFNDGQKKNIDVVINKDNIFSLYKDNKTVVVFELNENKMMAIKSSENELINLIENKTIDVKEISHSNQTYGLFKKLSNSGQLEKYNFNLYIKSSNLKKEVDGLFSKHYEYHIGMIK